LEQHIVDINIRHADRGRYKPFQNVNQSQVEAFNKIVAKSIAKICSVETEEFVEMMKYDEIDLLYIVKKKITFFVEVSASDCLWMI